MHFAAAAIAAAIALTIMPPATPAQAFSREELGQPFDGSRLSYEEARFMQATLAFTGDYVGMIDGSWGPASDRALKRYSDREFSGFLPSNRVAALAALRGWSIFDDGGWTLTYFESLGLSFLIPDSLEIGPEEDYATFDDRESSLSLIVDRGDGVDGWHTGALESVLRGTEPYLLRRDDIAVTSVQADSGSTIYVRSDYVRGAWSTIVIFTQPGDAGILAAVSGSIRKGDPGPIDLPVGGLLDTGIKSIIAENEDATAQDEAPPPSATVALPPQSDAPDDGHSASTGTGFAVSADGEILTNSHVIDGCSTILVGTAAATLLASDPTFDLALLSAPSLASDEFAAFTAAPAKLNSDLTVIGYPLHGLLSGLNVTRGSLTSLKGLGGASTQMQISAPVQPGNSGGPVLNSGGAVVGVVVSKLDAGLVQEAIGDVPQNVNFAIRGEVAKMFLSSNGIQPAIAPESPLPIAPEDLAEQAAGFTYLIECQ